MTAIQFEAARTCPSQVRQPRVNGALSGAVGFARETLREWRRRARDRAQLATLDDRMLRDIGLNSADAEFLANKPFWRE